MLILSKKDIDLTASLLKEGKVGIIPSDTIYGLCGIVNTEVNEKLYQIKKRKGDKKFIVLMTKKEISLSHLIVPDEIFSLWPAPFTAILNNGSDTLAVRVPNDSYLQNLLSKSGPIFSTSVNISGEKPLLTFEEITSVFGDKVDFIVKGRVTANHLGSTLIDVTKKPYRVIRQGEYKFDETILT